MAQPMERSEIPYLAYDDKDSDDLINMTRVRAILLQSDSRVVEGPGGVACFQLNGRLFGPLMQTHGTVEKFADPETLRDYTAGQDYDSDDISPEAVAQWIRANTSDD